MKLRFDRNLLVPIVLFGLILSTALIPHTSVVAQQAPPDTGSLIFLQYAVFDPRLGEPDVPDSLRLDALQPDEQGYYLVQFTDVIQPEWKEILARAGAVPLGYVPNNTLLVRMNGVQRVSVTDLAIVQWVGIYQPAYRIAPWMPHQDEGDIDLVLLTFTGVDLAAITSQLGAWGGQIQYTSENEFSGKIRVAIDASYIDDIARLNGIMWIEPWIEPALANDVAREILDVEDTVWDVHGLYGDGQIVAVADTGLDVGHDGSSMSDDFEGRIVDAQCLGRTNPCDWSDPNGHGTHVAGSVLGNGRNSGSNPTVHDYASSHAGIAPESRLVLQSTMAADGSLSGLPGDLNDLFQQAWDENARLHSNSWGEAAAGNYTHNSFEVDQFVWNHPDMIVLFAAGNEGVDSNSDGIVDMDSVDSPGTAKNSLTVGASENNRATGGFNPGGACGSYGGCWPTDFPTNPLHDDRLSDTPGGMAAFSSRGPVDGSRIKPDLVAPGTNVLSTRTHQHTRTMDAESGEDGWIPEGSWAITTTVAHGGTHSWSTGPYTNSVNISLTSPETDIRTGANTIMFWTQYEFGSGDSGVVEYERGTVIRRWETCTTLSGSSAGWVLRTCKPPVGDFNSFDEEHFRIRFRLESDNADVGSGWSIDDIQVTPSLWGYDDSAGVPDEHYFYSGGTSMATPLVAGSAALVREFYVDGGHQPSAALVKATLANGAENIAPGQYGTGTTQEMPDIVPNNVEGWGRVNVEQALFPTSPQTSLYRDIPNGSGMTVNNSHTYRYRVDDRSVPFRATLVWNDFPAFPIIGQGQIINDLDIEVEMPDGTIVHPNGGTGRDDVNNTEDVLIATNDVITGTYTVTVRGQDVPEGPQGYALVVRGGGLAEAGSVDVSLIIDSSGSMSWNDPSDMRKQGARVFVGTARNGDGLAVVDFDSTAMVRWPMTPLTDDRDAIYAAIDAIDSSGGTDIAAGLQAGYTELQAGENNSKAAVLMTDGESPDPSSVVSQYVNAGWPIYTIGLGSGINQQMLQQIADATGGSYTQLSDPNDLIRVYFEIVGAILGGTTVFNQQYPMQQGETMQATVGVPTNQSQVTFLVSWPGSRVDTTLTTPSGQQITPQTVDPNVYHAQGLTYELYRITNPESGDWIATMYGADLPPGGEIVELTVNAIGQTTPPPSPLVCNAAPEGFENDVPPLGWTVVNNVPNGPNWTNIAGCGELRNYTNGTGEAACTHVGTYGEFAWDTELRTPPFSLVDLSEASVTYQANFQSWSGIDKLDLDVSTDGGTTWTNLRSWNDDHGAFQNTPGEYVWTDLTPYAGEPNVMLRWHYYNPLPQAPGWYAQIDDVRLGCTPLPPTAVTLSDMEARGSQSPLSVPMASLPMTAVPAAAGLALAAVAWLRRKR